MIVEARWLGRLPYGEALARQRARREAILAGQAPEALWALEHDPVLSTGLRPPPGLPDDAALAAAGVARFQTERGGLATFHGPGQLVVYALLDLPTRGLGVKRLVDRLEQGVIDWLGARGVAAKRRCGYPGVWVPADSPAGLDKICAVGLHVRRGVSMHGLALNLRTDLSYFALFTPCGISDAGVTSLARLLGQAPSPEEAAPEVIGALARVLPLTDLATGDNGGGLTEGT